MNDPEDGPRPTEGPTLCAFSASFRPDSVVLTTPDCITDYESSVAEALILAGAADHIQRLIY